MVPGILGKKLGMTQVFDEKGDVIPVTVIEAGPCSVQAVKVADADGGYNSVQLGYDDTKEKRVKKPQREYLKAKKLPAKKFVREIRCSDAPDVKVGDIITNRIIQQGDFLDVTGTSKGKGFQGGMKRCGWYGGVETHGSMSHRAPGSIGASSYPSKVDKGHGMPGHMGSERRTVQNLKVVSVDTDNNTILVKGAVPGPNGAYIIIRYAKKKPLAERVQAEEEQEEQPQEEVATEGQDAKETAQAEEAGKEGNKE